MALTLTTPLPLEGRVESGPKSRLEGGVATRSARRALGIPLRPDLADPPPEGEGRAALTIGSILPPVGISGAVLLSVITRS